jgi:hypothetical protein
VNANEREVMEDKKKSALFDVTHALRAFEV